MGPGATGVQPALVQSTLLERAGERQAGQADEIFLSNLSGSIELLFASTEATP